MITVHIIGGLGNQMYCYALYRTLLERGRDVRMDISLYDYWDRSKRNVVAERKYELADVFNITERLTDRKIGYAKWFMMRVLRKLRVSGGWLYLDNGKGFQPEILDLKRGCLCGYWQSFKYSAEIEDILRKEFVFRKPMTDKTARVIDQIRNCNSVSISIRRGDYLRLGWSLPEEYYTGAIRYIQERVTNAKFFCISDDIDWCKKTYAGTNFTFVDLSSGDDAYVDMQVISECKYNILANSTFSIWGAWLNRNPNPIIVRPERYLPSRPDKNKDLWPQEWISLPLRN